MRILIMGEHYPPENVSGAVLAGELTEDLIARGHQISYVTCAPNYPAGIVYEGYRNSLLCQERLRGVKVVRIWSYICPKKAFWPRLLNYGTFSAMAFLGALVAGKPDVILSFSPPLPLGVSACLLSWLWRVPWILNVEDIYPEIAVVTGVLRNRTAIRILSLLERFLYRHATHIQVLSEGFRKNLLAKGVPEGKLSITPVWADPDAIRPMPKENVFRAEFELTGKFVVLYAGNFGFNTALEDVIDAADLLRSESAIMFLLVGEGVKKCDLEASTRQRGLHNIKFLPYQPRRDFAMMLAASDVGLVTLNEDAHHTSLPSKTFNIMASGRPILAVTPNESEIAVLVQDSACGLIVPPRHPNELARAILRLRSNSDLATKMGARGRRHLEENYSRRHCTEIFAHDFERLVY